MLYLAIITSQLRLILARRACLLFIGDTFRESGLGSGGSISSEAAFLAQRHASQAQMAVMVPHLLSRGFNKIEIVLSTRRPRNKAHEEFFFKWYSPTTEQNATAEITFFLDVYGGPLSKPTRPYTALRFGEKKCLGAWMIRPDIIFKPQIMSYLHRVCLSSIIFPFPTWRIYDHVDSRVKRSCLGSFLVSILSTGWRAQSVLACCRRHALGSCSILEQPFRRYRDVVLQPRRCSSHQSHAWSRLRPVILDSK